MTTQSSIIQISTWCEMKKNLGQKSQFFLKLHIIFEFWTREFSSFFVIQEWVILRKQESPMLVQH